MNIFAAPASIVGCNSVAARYEKESGKSQMSMLHAWGCGGSLGGALLGSMMAGRAVACSGLSLVTPFVFSAAGQQGPLAAGAVATMGSIGGLMGSPVIGTTAEALGMQAASGFIGLLSLVIAFVASRSALLRS